MESAPKWRMEGGRWVKTAGNSSQVPMTNGNGPKVNGTTADKSEPKVNGFAPKANGTPEPVSKVKEIPKVAELTNGDTNTNKSNGTETETDAPNNPYENLKFEDLLRGSTPDNIDERCIELCKTYLGGSWANIGSASDVTVTRISGGMTNQLYRVHLNDSVARVANDIYVDEPSDVAIKLYQEKHMKNYNQDDAERLNDNIILTIVSELEIGPKVYGIFNNGVMLAYHEHEQFRAKHQQDPELLKGLASLIARIHHLNVPILKNPNLMMKDFGDNIDYAFDKLNIQALIDELKLEHFSKKDLRVTFQEMLEHIRLMDSPVVFCHHDFRGGNIMVTQPERQIKIIDLEYCGYGQRGYDLGTFLTDWGKSEILEMMQGLTPPDDAVEHFARLYIEACDELMPGYASKPENSVKKVAREAKLFYAVQHMFFISIMIKQESSIIPSFPFDPKANITQVETVLARYNQIIDALIEDGTLTKLD